MTLDLSRVCSHCPIGGSALNLCSGISGWLHVGVVGAKIVKEIDFVRGGNIRRVPTYGGKYEWQEQQPKHPGTKYYAV